MREAGVELIALGQQITLPDLAKNTLRMISLDKKGEKGQASIIGSFFFVGILTAFPEVFDGEDLYKDTNFPVFDQFINLGHKMNIGIDTFPKLREVIRGQRQDAQEVEGFYYEVIQKWRRINKVLSSGYPEKPWVKSLARSYQHEILKLKAIIREENGKPNSNLRGLQELENAISLYHNVLAALGPEYFGGEEYFGREINELKGCIDLVSLQKKYAWIIEGQPTNETQRRMCGLFNLVMMAQMIDDWYDWKEDKSFGIKTLVTEAIERNQDINKAWEEIKKVMDSHFEKAMNFGVSRGAAWGSRWLGCLAKEILSRIPTRFSDKPKLLAAISEIN